MSERYYIPAADWNPDDLVLRDAEAHHCVDVMRTAPGQRVIAFNGAGAEATAEVLPGATGREVRLRALGVSQSAPLATRLVLGQAIPKGKNMDLIIQKATELGVAEIVPFLSVRTVVKLDADDAERKREKWQRVAVEACKQCGQNWLPLVRAPVSLEVYFASPDPDRLQLVAALSPDARPLRAILAEHAELHPGTEIPEALVIIGPEGDFTPAEIHLATNAGCQPLSLGPIILRTETAAIYSLSVLAYELLRGPAVS